MSKTVELARHLETLRINNMYKTDEEIDAVFTVADAPVRPYKPDHLMSLPVSS